MLNVYLAFEVPSLLLIMWLRLLSALRGAGSVVDDSLSIVAAIVLWGFVHVFGPWFFVQYLVLFLVFQYLAGEERAGLIVF